MSHSHDRGSHRCFRAVALGLSLFPLLIILSTASAGPYTADWQDHLATLPRQLTYTFHSPAHEIATDDAGLTTIAIDGFYPSGLPGDPNLPALMHHIALPPLVPVESVTLEITAVEQIDLPGTHQIAPAPPLLPADDTGLAGAQWGPNAATIVDGRNRAVYDRDALFPAQPVELAGVGHLRQWGAAKLLYWPVSYNPVTGQLRLTTAVTVTLRYDAPAASVESPAALLNTLADDRAAELFVNFDEAQSWYKGAPAGGQQPAVAVPTYAIVTTNRILDVAGDAIDRFFYHKTEEGWRVHVYTEDEYGQLDGSAPDQRADQVRQWLRDNYQEQNYQYVLLIGDPNPADAEEDSIVGDMPMKMVRGVPTDFYFSDLSSATGEMDWMAEVYVGRIPVYQSAEEWGLVLGNILDKTIAYEQSEDIGWRASALLPMAFAAPGSDGGEFGDVLTEEVLEPGSFDVHRMYWYGVVAHSELQSDTSLTGGSVVERLRQDQPGLLVWFGHGWAQGAAMYDEYGSSFVHMGEFIISSELDRVRDDRPALTFQASCKTGLPEDPRNIGYALLERGAVGTVSGSRDTYGWPGNTVDESGHHLSMAYHYVRSLILEHPIGKALAWTKTTPGGYADNALAYNLYGDPSLVMYWQLGRQATPATAQSEPDATANAVALLGLAAPDNPPAAGEGDAAQPFGQTVTVPSSTSTALTAVFDPELLLSSGFIQGCGIRPGGGVNCWSAYSHFTELWHNDADQEGSYLQAVTGLYHSCGLRANGSVHCWGRDDFGLGVDHPGPYVQITSGMLHVCGLRADGSIDCWGNNDAGQTNGSVYNDFVQVSAGMQHTCGLRAIGRVDCWGRNAFGQANDQLGPFAQIDSGYFHNCGLRPDGGVRCWGSSYYGQAVDSPGPYTQVSVGRYSTCALRPDGSVHCWGQYALDNDGPFLQISVFDVACGIKTDGSVLCWDRWGEGTQSAPFAPYAPAVDPQRLSQRTVLSAGGNHTCALMANGQIDCWGDNQYGQSAIHSGPFTAIEAGGNHTCGLGLNGRAVCWGKNDQGQAAGKAGPFLQVVTGHNYNCGLRPNGSVDCWGGDNDFGEVEDQNGPFVQLAAGINHVCGIKPNGSVACWGSNWDNQLNIPTGVIFRQLSAGGDHTCGLTRAGRILCWGRNADEESLAPTGIFLHVAAGNTHSCGLKLSGQVECWGRNDLGQASDNPGPFVRISAGDNHSCGLSPDGGACCWGDGQYEQNDCRLDNAFAPFQPYVAVPLVIR